MKTLPEISKFKSPRHYRSLFLSDLHLGHFGARADLLLAFLQHHRADFYFLVGDILDLWIPSAPVWSEEQTSVIKHFRQRHAEGAKLVYVRGNHDPHPETAPLCAVLPVEPVDFAVHEAADGRTYWIVHGDGQDRPVFSNHTLTVAGHGIEKAISAVESKVKNKIHLNWREDRNATHYLVSSFNRIRDPKRSYEKRLSSEAESLGFDGVICGHFHRAELVEVGNLVYGNCGDWVQSYSALAESHDGRLHLLERRSGYLPRPIGSDLSKSAYI